MQNNKIVPIIIITYNKLYKFTIPCIDSIISNTCYPYKIIVLDNGSTDDTVNILKEKYQHTGLIDILESKENHHWHGGNIKALEFVREKYNYDYFCLLNSDTLVSEGWLTKLTKHLTKNPNSISIVPTETIYKISILKKFYNEILSRQKCVTRLIMNSPLKKFRGKGLALPKEYKPVLVDGGATASLENVQKLNRFLEKKYGNKIVKDKVIKSGYCLLCKKTIQNDMIDYLAQFDPRDRNPNYWLKLKEEKGWDYLTALDTYVYHYRGGSGGYAITRAGENGE